MSFDHEKKLAGLEALNHGLTSVSGDQSGGASILHEITDHSQAEDAIRRMEERYRLLLESISDAVFVINREWKYSVVNEAAVRLVNMPREQFIGVDIREIFPGVEQTPFFKCYQRVMESRKPETVVDEFSLPDGYQGWYEVRVSPAPEGILCIGSEVTERKRAEERLESYRDQLRSLASDLSLSEERERRRIAVELHDQVGQILAMAKIKLGLLKKQVSARDLDEQFDSVTSLCNQAIKFTRSLTFELSPPVLYELGFDAALEWLVEQHRERQGIRVEFNSDGKKRPLGDDVRVVLFQAVRELLVNIAKHARAGIIKLSVASQDGSIRVGVEDDGVGFDISGLREGAGFGLFNIRERLEQIGGEMELESKPGAGTRVVLMAPFKKERTDQAGRLP